MPVLLFITAFIIASAGINSITNDVANILGPAILLLVAGLCVGIIVWTFRK